VCHRRQGRWKSAAEWWATAPAITDAERHRFLCVASREQQRLSHGHTADAHQRLALVRTLDVNGIRDHHTEG
jgi:hypothetical protein